jgi:hypothetical protein
VTKVARGDRLAATRGRRQSQPEKSRPRRSEGRHDGKPSILSRAKAPEKGFPHGLLAAVRLPAQRSGASLRYLSRPSHAGALLDRFSTKYRQKHVNHQLI